MTNPAFWLVVGAGKILLYLPTGHGNAFVRFCPCVYKNWNSFLYAKKNNLGLENAALGLRPWAAFSRPQSQFFTIRTDPKPVNNIYLSENKDFLTVFKKFRVQTLRIGIVFDRLHENTKTPKNDNILDGSMRVYQILSPRNRIWSIYLVAPSWRHHFQNNTF